MPVEMTPDPIADFLTDVAAYEAEYGDLPRMKRERARNRARRMAQDVDEYRRDRSEVDR